ncbi:hypothetical protein [Priestia megaterium]
MGTDAACGLGRRVTRNPDFGFCVGSGTDQAEKRWAASVHQTGPANKTLDGVLRIPWG